MQTDVRDALQAACVEVGIIYKDVPADGRWHATDVDDVFEYIETDYNAVRRHSTLNYLSPRDFEKLRTP